MDKCITVEVLSLPANGVYYTRKRADGLRFNQDTGLYEAYDELNWTATKYCITMTRVGTTFEYEHVATNVLPGEIFLARAQQGASPSPSADIPAGTEDVPLLVTAEAASAIDLMYAAAKVGTVDDATQAPTTTVFETSFTVNSDEFTKMAILWTSGDNKGFVSRISAYAFTANSKVELTISEALPNTPADNDQFYVIGRIE